ncbi:hypothetical protein [Nocardia sp. X0981]
MRTNLLAGGDAHRVAVNYDVAEAGARISSGGHRAVPSSGRITACASFSAVVRAAADASGPCA